MKTLSNNFLRRAIKNHVKEFSKPTDSNDFGKRIGRVRLSKKSVKKKNWFFFVDYFYKISVFVYNGVTWREVYTNISGSVAIQLKHDDLLILAYEKPRNSDYFRVTGYKTPSFDVARKYYDSTIDS